jgi:hypothetical protein
MNPSGFPALGKVWFSIEDSGYARGTADGTTWSRMSIPSFAPLLMLTSERSGGIVTATGFTESFELRMGYSVDTGRTWVEGGLDSPGSNVLAVEGGYYLGATGMASDDADLWITRSLGSNWETMGAGCGFFSENGIAHVVKPDGIYTVSGVGTGISRKAGAIALGRVSRQGGRLVARLDASLVGRSWSLVTASGTVQSRGVADGAEITLPHLRGAGWLKVGDATMAVPAF